jgi:hypothetical protein
LNEAIGLSKETRPKFVISHAAPSEAAREILKGLTGSYFLSKHGDAANVFSLSESASETFSAIKYSTRSFSASSCAFFEPESRQVSSPFSLQPWHFPKPALLRRVSFSVPSP